MATFDEIVKANATIVTQPIKGKNYAEVNQRVKAFRMVYPQGTISSDIVSIENGVVVIKATCADETGTILGTGYAYEKEGSSFINKESYIENCETSAVGRALGFAGFGIDTSICSAEELNNAILNQKNLIGEKQKEMITGLAKEKGVSINEIIKTFKIKSLDDMTKEMFAQATQMLNNTERRK